MMSALFSYLIIEASELACAHLNNSTGYCNLPPSQVLGTLSTKA